MRCRTLRVEFNFPKVVPTVSGPGVWYPHVARAGRQYQRITGPNFLGWCVSNNVSKLGAVLFAHEGMREFLDLNVRLGVKMTDTVLRWQRQQTLSETWDTSLPLLH